METGAAAQADKESDCSELWGPAVGCGDPRTMRRASVLQATMATREWYPTWEMETIRKQTMNYLLVPEGN